MTPTYQQIPSFMLLGYETFCVNDPLQKYISLDMQRLMEKHVPILLAYPFKNQALIQYFAFDAIKNGFTEDNYLNGQVMFNLGLGRLASVNEIQPIMLQPEATLRCIETQDYWFYEIQVAATELNAAVNKVWEELIWTSAMFEKRSFKLDFMAYITTDNANFTVQFYIGVKNTLQA